MPSVLIYVRRQYHTTSTEPAWDQRWILTDNNKFQCAGTKALTECCERPRTSAMVSPRKMWSTTKPFPSIFPSPSCITASSAGRLFTDQIKESPDTNRRTPSFLVGPRKGQKGIQRSALTKGRGEGCSPGIGEMQQSAARTTTQWVLPNML